MLKKGKPTDKEFENTDTVLLGTDSFKVRIPVELLNRAVVSNKAVLHIDRCTRLHIMYEKMYKWLLVPYGSFDFNEETEEFEDNTVLVFKPNPDAEAILNMAKRFNCKWAEDEEFPPPPS